MGQSLSYDQKIITVDFDRFVKDYPDVFSQDEILSANNGDRDARINTYAKVINFLVEKFPSVKNAFFELAFTRTITLNPEEPYILHDRRLADKYFYFEADKKVYSMFYDEIGKYTPGDSPIHRIEITRDMFTPRHPFVLSPFCEGFKFFCDEKTTLTYKEVFCPNDLRRNIYKTPYEEWFKMQNFTPVMLKKGDPYRFHVTKEWTEQIPEIDRIHIAYR